MPISNYKINRMLLSCLSVFTRVLSLNHQLNTYAAQKQYHRVFVKFRSEIQMQNWFIRSTINSKRFGLAQWYTYWLTICRPIWKLRFGINYTKPSNCLVSLLSAHIAGHFQQFFRSVGWK